MHRVRSSALAIVGFMLSPLSWWNDAVVNVPLAYLFAAGVTWPWPELFMPAVVLGYWLTNVVGLVLLHRGLAAAAQTERQSGHWRRDVLVSLLYTSAIIALVLLGWIKPPTAYLK